MTGPLVEALGLESLDQVEPLSFPDLLDRLWRARYQGSMTLHFAGGVPRSVVLSQPIQLPLEVVPAKKS